jgi:16S rRNA (adenine1518-N6/adenine1519-N6)-dimethyltransferase
MPEEIFDVVDIDDNVITQATRSEVHAQNLLHRAANIFVFNTNGQLLLQKRSATKDQFPLCYTSSASGHLDAGETYEQAAVRELEEELGLKCPLEYLGKLPASTETAYEHSVLFRTVTDEQPALNPEEIEIVKYCDIKDIESMILHAPELFAPPFRELFRWYLKFYG